MMLQLTLYPDNFKKRVTLVDNCWLWTGMKTEYGYARLYIKNKKNTRAHKWAYEQLYGVVPDGLVLDHLCRVRHCVNPEHLEAVTPRINVLRGMGTASLNAQKTHCFRGHPLLGSNLLLNRDGRGRRCHKCFNEYQRNYQRRLKVSQAGVSNE